jgi:16S rRNA processing protein RimM
MDRVEVGYVARAHGVRGELRVHTHDPQSTTLLDVARVWIGGVERQVTGLRETSGALLMSIKGVDDKDAADALRGKNVEVLRADVPLAPGEFLLGDLPGCAVVDESGAPLGVVADVLHGAQALLVIRDEAAGVERLLPLVDVFVQSVDVAARQIIVTLPDDLPVEKLR